MTTKIAFEGLKEFQQKVSDLRDTIDDKLVKTYRERLIDRYRNITDIRGDKANSRIRDRGRDVREHSIIWDHGPIAVRHIKGAISNSDGHVSRFGRIVPMSFFFTPRGTSAVLPFMRVGPTAKPIITLPAIRGLSRSDAEEVVNTINETLSPEIRERIVRDIR